MAQCGVQTKGTNKSHFHILSHLNDEQIFINIVFVMYIETFNEAA